MLNYIQRCQLHDGTVVHANEKTPLAEILREIFGQRIYTPAGQRQLQKNDVVVDLGANIGVFALYAARHDPSVRVVAVEASSENVALLRKNVRANKLKNVEVRHAAVAGKSGKLILQLDPHSVCHRAFDTPNPEYKQRRAGVEEVEAISLEDLFARHGIERCNLLKVDVEGSEYELLFSASPETLARIDAITLEYHDYLVEHNGIAMAKFLTARGFDVQMKPQGDLGHIYASRKTAAKASPAKGKPRRGARSR